jgi:uncharacterized protein YdeI (YjbR/CyaY-like superfamily)
MDAVFFANPAEFRTWLANNHETANELLVGYYKVETKKPSMTWSESVDQALCFGWIDGVRRTIDKESYCIRFTPRRPKSIWSAVNIQKIAELTAQGLMHPKGIEAFEKRKENKSTVYSYENQALEFADNFIEKFKESPQAWEFFQKQAPYYQKNIKYWVMSAKQESTRLSRLEKLILASAKGERLT